MTRNIFFIVFPFFVAFNIFKKLPAPTPSGKIELSISFTGKKQTKSCRHIDVFLVNHTDSVASFFEDWNEWGYFNISLLVKTNNKVYRLNKKLIDWIKNFPSYKTLFPGDTLKLEFTLNAEDLNCTDYSDFDGVIPSNDTSATIRAIYHLSPGKLEEANSFYFLMDQMIKYKKVFKENKEKGFGFGEWIIVDSLKNPVEAKKTFPLVRLESEEYKLN